MLEIKSPWVGESQATQQLLRAIEGLSQIDSPILIIGENGTGKEMTARAIHGRSLRAQKPFAIMSCANFQEAEFFDNLRKTSGGTIYLEEVDLIPLSQQHSLARGFASDVRVLASTTKNLVQAVEKHEFRKELCDQLMAHSIKTPSLRDIKSDIPLLVRHIVDKFNKMTGHTLEQPSEEILKALMAYDWPGNIRELEDLLERLVISKGHGRVDLGDLPHRIFRQYADGRPDGGGALSEWEFPRMALPNLGVDLKTIVDAFENHLIDQALARTQNNKNRASELLQMNRTTLVEKLRKRGMIVPAAKRQENSGLEPAASVVAAAAVAVEVKGS